MSEAVVKPGYKKTEVGVIPEDWDLYSIEKICSRITDGEHITPRRAENGIFLLSARNIHNGYLLLDDVDFFLEPDYLKFKKRVNPESGDLLISCSGTIGRVCVVPDSLMFGLVRSVAIIKPIKEIIESNYLMFLFQFDTVQKQIQKSVNQLAQANLFQGQIRQLIIPCPLKKEQRAIAAALSDADGLIGALETLIAKKRAIKQAAMQQLLTGRTRLPGFAKSSGYKKTEVGVIPEDWDLGTLKKFSLTRDNPIQTGPFGAQLHSYDYVNEGIPLILINNIVNGKISTAGIPKITSHKAIALSKYRIKVGDIVFSRVGAVGRTALIEVGEAGWLISGQMLRIRLENHEINNKFLYYFTLTPEFQKQLISETVGTTRMSINTEILGKLLIIAPSPCEQRAIATVLSDMDAEITALEQRLEKTQQIKQGMMQQLLTGCIRLPALN